MILHPILFPFFGLEGPLSVLMMMCLFLMMRPHLIYAMYVNHILKKQKKRILEIKERESCDPLGIPSQIS